MSILRAIVPALAALSLAAAALPGCGSDKSDTGPSAAEVGAATPITTPSGMERPVATPTAHTGVLTTPEVRMAAPTAQPPAPEAGAATPAAAATRPPTQAVPDASYDPTLMMYAKFPGLDRSFELTEPAFDSIRRHNDVSQVPVLVDLLMILPPSARDDVEELLQHLTGQDIPAEWQMWAEWLGKHREEYPPPEGYATWKRGVFAAIDRRFTMLLRGAEDTVLIDLTELAWGGVPPDGIPDLQDPSVLSAGEADYLAGDERVFGLSIGGEHRAYPLRIINPHEMVNDTLGGEPVALSW